MCPCFKLRLMPLLQTLIFIDNCAASTFHITCLLRNFLMSGSYSLKNCDVLWNYHVVYKPHLVATTPQHNQWTTAATQNPPVQQANDGGKWMMRQTIPYRRTPKTILDHNSGGTATATATPPIRLFGIEFSFIHQRHYDGASKTGERCTRVQSLTTPVHDW
jgi:hypothetical protein